MEEPETEDAGVLFDPTEVLEDAATIPVPESQGESFSPVEQSLLSQFGDVPKYGTKGYDDFKAFSAIRMETPEAMKWLKKQRAYSNRNKAAQGKVFTYEKCSPRESMDPEKSCGTGQVEAVQCCHRPRRQALS